MRKILVLLLGCSLLLLPAAAWAQAEEEAAEAVGNVSRIYLQEVLPGHTAAFLEAAAVHTQWHSDQGDDWTWVGFYIETGTDAGKYGWATANHWWSDFDEYDANLGPADGAHFGAVVGAHVKSHTSWFSVAMPQMSNPPPPGTSYPLYQVVDYHIVGGHQAAFVSAVTEAHEALQAGGWDRHYGWSVREDGEGPTFTLLLPLENWAALAAPEVTFEQVMAQQLGAERTQEILSAIGSATASTDSRIVRVLPELSHVPAQQ